MEMKSLTLCILIHSAEDCSLTVPGHSLGESSLEVQNWVTEKDFLDPLLLLNI